MSGYSVGCWWTLMSEAMTKSFFELKQMAFVTSQLVVPGEVSHIFKISQNRLRKLLCKITT